MFKPGDKVKIREDLEVGKFYGHLDLVSGMADYLGATAVVQKYCKPSYELEENPYFWSPEMLEPVKEE